MENAEKETRIAQTLSVGENVDYVASALYSGFRPPPDMTISQWAEENRVLSGAASSSPGRWRNDRTPYLVEIMDQLSPQSPATDVVFMKGAQVGGTECLINTALYYICHDPCPIGLFQTTETTAKRFIKQRMNTAFQAMHIDKLFTGDEMYLREFPGGVMITGWSNSASNLRSMPIRIALCDEISGWAKDCEGEGDPCSLVEARTVTFARKKRFWNSTPGIEGECRITDRFRKGDMRYYNVPCPLCGTLHVWKWENLVWDRSEDGSHMPWTVRMKCPHCGGEYGEYRKPELLARGEWLATNDNGAYPSYHLSGLYAPLGAGLSWADAVTQFLNAQGDINLLKTFTNNVLGEAWNIDGGMQIDRFGLIGRREEYGAEVPSGAVILTAGVDTQDDRLECEIVGWGAGLESWGIAHKVFVGDPSQPAVWDALDTALTAEYRTEAGESLHVAATLIDSGGHHTDDVYRFTAKREWRNVFACAGHAGAGRQIVTRPKRTKKSSIQNATVVIVGVDSAKDQLYDWLTKEVPCPGYCHFPLRDGYDDEYFAQLTAEKRVRRWVRGQLQWGYKKVRERNEALDTRIYARAALNLVGVDVDKMAEAGVKFMRNVARPVARISQGLRTISKGVKL